MKILHNVLILTLVLSILSLFIFRERLASPQTSAFVMTLMVLVFVNKFIQEFRDAK